MRINLKKLALALSLGAVVAGTGLTGCATSDRTAGRRLDDHKVSHRVKNALADDPVFKFEDVRVDTFNGVVQLNGFANTQDQKNEAARIAQGVRGVKELINNISLKPQENLEPTGRSTTGSRYDSGNPPPSSQNTAPTNPNYGRP